MLQTLHSLDEAEHENARLEPVTALLHTIVFSLKVKRFYVVNHVNERC